MTLKKAVFITCAVLLAIVAACILVYHMLTSGRVDPLALLLLAAGISIVLPMVRAHFFASAADCRAELNFHIQRQDAFVRQQVADKLGPEAVQRIGAAAHGAAETPAEYILSLLANEGERWDVDLRFALLIILSRYYEKTGDPEAAIEYLTAALQSRPQDFVTRFCLARNLEWQGKPGEALAVYQLILNDTAALSRAMIKLIRRQMEALRGG